MQQWTPPNRQPLPAFHASCPPCRRRCRAACLRHAARTPARRPAPSPRCSHQRRPPDLRPCLPAVLRSRLALLLCLPAFPPSLPALLPSLPAFLPSHLEFL